MLSVTQTKRCTHCAEVKDLEEFTKHPTTRDRRGSWCKKCTCEAARRMRESDPERTRRASADWYQRNSGRARALQKEYYQANREQMIAGERIRRAKRKATGVKPRLSSAARERKKIAYRKWQQAHAEQINAYARDRYAKMPGLIRGYQHKRRAALIGNGGTYTNEEWVALTEKCGQRCLACGKQKVLTVDHVIPLSKGGTNSIDNIQPLCRNCNSSKKERAFDYRLTQAPA